LEICAIPVAASGPPPTFHLYCTQEDSSMQSSNVTPEHDVETMIRWTDDSIRWTDTTNRQTNTNQLDDDGADVNPDEMGGANLFKDPDPSDTFSFRFNIDVNEVIEIELRGYKENADEIWKSTGLTLWRASEHLCDYMLTRADQLKGKRILEVCWGLNR
jgi:hypothetical protein